MQVLETDRLRLRAWRDLDVDFVLDMYTRWEVQRFLGVRPNIMADRNDAEAAIARWRSLDHPVQGIWAVQHREQQQLLGTVLLKPIPASSDQTPLPPSDDIEIGWHFHPDVWGHGYATEAASRVLAYGFDSGLNRIVAVTDPANAASQAVAKRIGMIAAGQTARYYNKTLDLFVAVQPAS